VDEPPGDKICARSLRTGSPEMTHCENLDCGEVLCRTSSSESQRAAAAAVAMGAARCGIHSGSGTSRTGVLRDFAGMQRANRQRARPKAAPFAVSHLRERITSLRSRKC